MKENIVLANQLLNEWCGTHEINYYGGISALGNLLKYAVPKLDDWNMGKHTTEGYWATAHIHGKELAEGKNQDPALALFWSIYGVIKGE